MTIEYLVHINRTPSSISIKFNQMFELELTEEELNIRY